MAETASLCGFGDASHFSDFFRRKTGLSPSTTRRPPRPAPRGCLVHYLDASFLQIQWFSRSDVTALFFSLV
ncbi:MAG: helix-turn-helix domain-containing protein [Spirochaetia bacterium]